MSKYIPIYEYAEKNNISRQNVYRWIREHKFNQDDIKTEVVTRERLRIRSDAQPK